jgi:hypothetical protein
MQIPSESFEAIGYCLLSVESVNNKYCICEIDVSGMSDKSNISESDSIYDSSSNVISESYSDNEEKLSISEIDFDIDISDIDISDIDTFYIEKKQLPNVIIEKHEEKKIVDNLDFCEFFCVVSTIIELFVFEEASYLFDIFG